MAIAMVVGSMGGSGITKDGNRASGGPRREVVVFLERNTPSISTDSALDHSHLARDAKTCK